MSAPTTLITVTHDSAVALRRHWSARDRLDAEWIVVDNASSDGSVQVAHSLGADRVVPLARNVGFSAANNVGAALASSECLVFVNPDVSVDAESLGLVRDLALSRRAIVAPQLLHPDGSPQENGRTAPHVARKLAHFAGSRLSRTGYEVLAPAGEIVAADWAMGAAVAMSHGVFEELGGWDPRFFLYYEDSDLGLRAARLGIPTLIHGSARWVHGWERATRRQMSLRHWRFEIRSGSRFYARYPQLILPPRGPHASGASGRRWTPADG